MALDIDGMAPEAHAYYLAIGERYTTPDVLAQVDMSLAGLVLYGALLAPCGFGAEDGQDMLEGREVARAEESGGAQTATDHKATTLNAADVIDTAKQRRQDAITILKGTKRVSRQRGNKNAMALVTSALSKTSALTDDSALPTQLSVLQVALEDPALAAVVAGGGGPECATDLATLQPAVRAALSDRTSAPAITAAAQRRDILDGILVTLARQARAAARRAARKHGQPAIAAAFELIHLEPRRRKAPSADVPEPPAPPAAEPAAPGTVPAAE
jgi:hypothetical protein